MSLNSQSERAMKVASGILTDIPDSSWYVQRRPRDSYQSFGVGGASLPKPKPHQSTPTPLPTRLNFSSAATLVKPSDWMTGRYRRSVHR